MYRFFLIGLSLWGGALLLPGQTPPPPAQAPAAAPKPAGDRVVITVGSEKITAAQFEEFVDALPAQYRAMARGAAKRQFADQIVAIKSLAQEARKRKLDQNPSYKRQLAFQEENLLAGSLFQNLTDTLPITETDARTYYDQHKSEFESARARHILVRFAGSPMPLPAGKKDLPEPEALARVQELKKRLEAGEEFAKMAQAESDDTTSATKGGDLGTFRRGQMVPAFDSAAFTIALNKVSDPVKSQFGFHLIRVEERTAQPFETVRSDIDKKIRPEMVKKALEDLRKAANIQVDDSYFAPTGAPPTPQPAPVKP